jgi:uncharacterized protein YkwD
MFFSMRRTGLIAATVLVLLAAPATASACPDEDSLPPELGVQAARDSVLCLINERRREHGLGKLRSDPRLERAAQDHSASMDAGNFFAHNAPNGSTPLSRIRSTGYLSGAGSWGIAENIRWGAAKQGTPDLAVIRWMASAGHRQAILSPRYRQIGIGVAIGSPTGDGGNAAIYTTDFGYRK